MFSQDEYIPISAIQHWLYCPRQYALIHLERAWSENQFTAEGRVLHEHAHEGSDESRGHFKITRTIPVRSDHLGLIGQCDIVEFYDSGQIIPVEYKRGKPKAHQADEAQLCAQALCLEEMLETTIEYGALFYGKTKRRKEIAFDTKLRNLVQQTTQTIRECYLSKITPKMQYDPKRCDACSLIDQCQPKAMRLKKGTIAWFHRQLILNLAADASPENLL